MNNRPDVLVIGAGMIGMWTAYFLRRQGKEVMLIDQGSMGGPIASSFGNTGYIGTSGAIPLAEPGVIRQGLLWLLNPESPFYIRPRWDWDLLQWLWRFRKACRPTRVKAGFHALREMKIKSLDLFQQFKTDHAFSSIHLDSGKIILFNTENGFANARKAAEPAIEMGTDLKFLSKEEVQRMVPDLSLCIHGGIYNKEDGFVYPEEFGNQMTALLDRMQVACRSFCKVYGFATKNNRISGVKTTQGLIVPREIVIASGVWAAELGKSLGFKLPLQAGKGYSITIDKPQHAPGLPLMLSEGKVALTPFRDGLRLAGTLELSGFDISINQKRLNGILKTVQTYLPQFDSLAPKKIWSGLRPCTPDGIPLIGRSKKYDNLTVSAGHAMIGISTAPITGKLTAQIVADESPDMDLTPFRIDRYPNAGN